MSVLKTYIANLALGHIGQDEIETLTGGDKPANTCSRHYLHAIDLALEAYDWPFARAYIVGNVVPTEGLAGWSYAYAYPALAIAVRRIAKDAASESNQEFTLGMTADGGGRVIFTNRRGARFVCTVRPGNETLYTPSFVEVAGWSLARLIVMPLTKDAKLKEFCERGFINAIKTASTISANEEGDEATLLKTDPDWIKDRDGATPSGLPPVATEWGTEYP
jgi:hypothetical protein